MPSPAVSVIVVSRERPDALALCLTGLKQVSYSNFEIVVVADPQGLAVVDAEDGLKAVAFNEANISKARNLGIQAASGEIVAFIDDDAVPEPNWLIELVSAFTDPEIDATGGYVLGRNGISLQWASRQIDARGRAKHLAPGKSPDSGYTVKTEGTNMAFRKRVLEEIGGFDEAFRFYLDETDLNFRMGNAGYKTVLRPDAVVHHGFLASTRRRSDRVPLDLVEIGASLSVYLRKHCPGSDLPALLNSEREEQKTRLDRHRAAGRLTAEDQQNLLEGFDRGVETGNKREFGANVVFEPNDKQFKPFRRQPAFSGNFQLSCTRIGASRHRKMAAEAAIQGKIVSLYVFSITARYHRVRFDAAGFWEQSGGLFGRSDRAMPLFRYWRFRARVADEIARVSKWRRIVVKNDADK